MIDTEGVSDASKSAQSIVIQFKTDFFKFILSLI